MAEERKEMERIKTPAGIAKYAWITVPSDKYHNYQCTLRVAKDAPGLKEFMAKLDEVADEQFKIGLEECCKDLSAKKAAEKKAKHERHVPFEVEEDNEDKETGFILIKATRKDSYKDKAKVEHPVKLAVFDARGNRLDKVPQIYNGSKLILSCGINPYANKENKSGVGLKLLAVQILDLRSGGRNASDYGFGEEEGYTAGPDVTGEEAF